MPWDQIFWIETIHQIQSSLFTWLPRILGALLLLIVGWLVARVSQAVIARLLRKLGLDNFAERTGINQGLVTEPDPGTLKSIHELKRELIFLRKSVWPLREVIGALERGESPLFQESSLIYLRDAYDHTIQIIDTVETFRDMVSGMLDIYLSSISNRMNEVMKVLTIIATVFIPLSFIVGLYGMNFKYMPELQWKWGYFMVWGVIISVVVGMLAYFRRKKWF